MQITIIQAVASGALRMAGIALAALSVACGQGQVTYFPLRAGVKWHYDVAITTRDGLEKQRYFLANLGKKQLNEKKVFVRRSLEGTSLFYEETGSGIYYLGQISERVPGRVFNAGKQIVLPLPPRQHMRWQAVTETRLLKKTGPPQSTEFRITATVPLEAEIVSLSETVTVPAGTFKNCLEIAMSGSTMKDAGNYVGLTQVNVEETRWYAPGTGLVKMERLETTRSEALDRGSLLIELAGYEAG